MTLTDATLIGVGAMIGAGIFVLIGIAAGVAGPGLIVTFILNGLVALLTAMSYAELGSCYHDAGGGYLWVKEGLPKWNGFISGWMSWFAHAVACSLYALGFGAYFGHVLHELGVTMPQWGFLSSQKLLAVAVAILFGYINFRGASETGKIGNLITMTKIVILAIFVGLGIELILHHGNWQAAFTPLLPHGWSGVFKAMGLTFIAFQGYEVIAQSSEEIKNPKKNIPRAVFLSLVIVIPIYLLVAVAALGSVNSGGMTPWDYLALHKETALVEVAKNFFSGGGILILIGGLISTISALNATIYSSSRVAFAMGRDRNFPTFFSRVHPQKFTPHWAILVSLLIVILMAVSLPIEDVASAADIMFLLLFLQVNLAMIRLRKKRPDLDRGFIAPLFPWLSILGIVLLLAIAVYMFNYSPVAWIVTIVWIVIGLVVYKFYASQREVEHIQKVKALERIEHKDYRVLVPLANPNSLKSLTNIALAISKKNQAEIIFLSIVEVDEGHQLREGYQETAKVQSILEQAETLAVDAGVAARTLIKMAHRISQGIIETAVEEECNFIILGRQKHPTFLNKVFASLIDTVIQKSPSEVAILHGEFNPQNVRTVLIPFDTDIHAKLAAEIAPILCEYFQAELRIGYVMAPALPESEKKLKIELLQSFIDENSLPGSMVIINEADTLKGVLKMAREADLMIMGGRSGDFLELLAGKSLAQEITEQSKCPVLWIKEYEERPSFWALLFKSTNQNKNQKVGD